MNRRKAIILIASLLLASLLFYIRFVESNQIKRVSVNINPPVMEEKVVISTAAQVGKEENVDAEAEQKVDEANDEDEPKTLTEEIKERVREVLEGTLNLFKKDLQIVAIGDSLTQGVGDETNSGGYVGILNNTFEANNLNIAIENLGKRGNRTDQLLKRLEKEEISSSIRDADVVLVTIGANDIMQVAKNNLTNLNMEPFHQEKQGYIDRLSTIFNKISEINPDIKIYLIGFYNPFEQYFADIEEFGIITENWNVAGRMVTAEYENVQFIPIGDIFTYSDTNLLADDHFHPNTNGYKQIAKRVLENMEEIKIEQEEPPLEAVEQ